MPPDPPSMSLAVYCYGATYAPGMYFSYLDNKLTFIREDLRMLIRYIYLFDETEV